MTLLVISPDYASHLLPLAGIAGAWHRRGERVVVATGEATAALVEGFGYDRSPLQLARGSNPGVMRAEKQVAEEADSLRGFFDATRQGMVATLEYQARERLTDLMWRPVETARAVLEVVDRVRPDAIVVDHLAFSARLALNSARIPHADVVLGHPSALPVGDEVYGFPTAWPRAFAPDPAALERLRGLCERVRDAFTAEWNAALAALAPGSAPAQDAFTEHGATVLYNYPAQLSDPLRVLPPHVFLGSTLRDEAPDPQTASWLDDDRPFVYVSFGSFLSARDDVLATVVAALRQAGVRAAIALGSADPARLGPVPGGWLVREYLPQLALLERAAVAITHGGNNSVTEAVASGVPMLVLPFSTDQFAGAAAIERAGWGEALDPNAVRPQDLAAAVDRLLRGDARPPADLAATLRELPGSERAYAELAASPTSARIAAGSPDAAR